MRLKCKQSGLKIAIEVIQLFKQLCYMESTSTGFFFFLTAAINRLVNNSVLSVDLFNHILKWGQFQSHSANLPSVNLQIPSELLSFPQ